ncbi:MAG: hypothetical protein M3R69_04880 [Acidobacteriota bacterium]|nr:hypothetical protein [Acidobacteriota bacterium]
MGIFNSTVLDVIIGLVFVYLLLAILCTAANEWVAAFTRRRGEMLRQGIQQLLASQPTQNGGDANEFRQEFYAHPLITSLMHDGNHPTYISPRNFAAVVTDVTTSLTSSAVSFGSFEKGVSELPEGNVRKTLLALLQRSSNSPGAAADKRLELSQQLIEGWFNDAMDRVSGWYKRRTQLWTIIIATALTLVANADTTHIARRLWTDPVLRSAVVEEAKVRAQKPGPTISVEYEDEDDPTKPTVTRTEGNQVSAQERDVLGQLLGWRGTLQDNTWKDWLERVLGWLMTVLALSMGAPFWFDILNKFMNVRFAGKSPDETSKKPEKLEATIRA